MALADIGWSLNGVDAYRWRVQHGSIWRLPVSRRRSVLTIPGHHGSIPTGAPPVYEEASASLEMLCKGEMVDLEAATNELYGIVTTPGLVLGRYSGGLETSAPAEFVSISPGQFTPDVGAFFTVLLAVPGVFMRGASADSVPVVVTSGATVTIATLAGSTAPVPDATLRLEGPATSVAAVDPVNGTGLSWTGVLSAGEYLFLDAQGLTARISSTATDWTAGGTDETSGLDYPPAGPLQIQPRMEGSDPADRRCKLTITGTGFTAATELTVRAAPSYL